MKSILFNAFPDEGHSRRLDLALDLARQFDAHLTLVNAMPYEAALATDSAGAAFAALVPIWRAEATKLRNETEADLANEDVSWDWIEEAGPVSLALLKRSTLADIVLVGEREPQANGKAPSFTAGELALSADCPVLVLPDECRRLELERPAFIAWDGSPEASHAMKAAVPLLKSIKSAFIATVFEGKQRKKTSGEVPAVEAGNYLSRHGISCEVVEIDGSTKDTAMTLRDAAITRGSGMIVMGAYGRRRLSEQIFGGVTRSMLSDCRLPLLIRH